MATEQQNNLTDDKNKQIHRDIKVEAPVINLQLPQVNVAPHSQFWTPESDAALNARLAADRQAFNAMLAREFPSSVAPPPLSDAEKAMKKMFDDIINRPQPDPSTFLRKS